MQVSTERETVGFTLYTMQRAYQEIAQGADHPWVPLGDFGNHFFYYPEIRSRLIADPIEEPEHATNEQHRWAVFCAASVEYLCERYAVSCPDWVHAPKYSALAEPWYTLARAATSELLRQRLEAQAPAPFARRNIFCTSRVWVSKHDVAEELRARRRGQEKQPA